MNWVTINSVRNHIARHLPESRVDSFAMHRAVTSRPRHRLGPRADVEPSAALIVASFYVRVSMIEEPSASAAANIAGVAVFLDPVPGDICRARQHEKRR